MTEDQVRQDAEAVRRMFQEGLNKEETDKRAKILERVRAILVLADDEQRRNPAAADNYRKQADQLMVAYAIEQWQVDQAQAKTTGRVLKPERRFFDFAWWYRHEFSSDLYSMFCAIAQHCRCVIAHRGHGKDGRSIYEMPVIGLSSDLDYLDLLFTNLLLEMGKQLEPKPEANLTFGENAYRLRASGMARPRVATLLYEMGQIPGTGPGTDYWDNFTGERIPYNRLAPNKEKGLRSKCRVAGEKWGAANGYGSTTTVNPKVWQRSFARGFADEIRSRLYDMRRLREEESTGESTALALRNIYEMALELYKEMYPPPPPPKPLTEEQKKALSKVKIGRMPAPPKMSGRAMAAGREAGRKVDISSHPSKGIRNNPRRLPQ